MNAFFISALLLCVRAQAHSTQTFALTMTAQEADFQRTVLQPVQASGDVNINYNMTQTLNPTTSAMLSERVTLSPQQTESSVVADAITSTAGFLASTQDVYQPEATTLTQQITPIATTFPTTTMTSGTSTIISEGSVEYLPGTDIPYPLGPFPAATGVPPASMQSILDKHNELRALHRNTTPLKWSPELAQHAQNYVDALKSSSFAPCSGQLLHSSPDSRPNIGENLAYGTMTPLDLVQAWYDEIKFYNYADPLHPTQKNQEVGHFTQLVWADTTTVGCAMYQCPLGSFSTKPVFLICQYSNIGNIVGVYQNTNTFSSQFYNENVHPLI